MGVVRKNMKANKNKGKKGKTLTEYVEAQAKTVKHNRYTEMAQLLMCQTSRGGAYLKKITTNWEYDKDIDKVNTEILINIRSIWHTGLHGRYRNRYAITYKPIQGTRIKGDISRNIYGDIAEILNPKWVKKTVKKHLKIADIDIRKFNTKQELMDALYNIRYYWKRKYGRNSPYFQYWNRAIKIVENATMIKPIRTNKKEGRPLKYLTPLDKDKVKYVDINEDKENAKQIHEQYHAKETGESGAVKTDNDGDKSLQWYREHKGKLLAKRQQKQKAINEARKNHEILKGERYLTRGERMNTTHQRLTGDYGGYN